MSQGLDHVLVELFNLGGFSFGKKNNNYEHEIKLKALKRPVQVRGLETSVPLQP